MKIISTTFAALLLTLSSTIAFGASMTVVDPNSDFSVTYDTDEAGLFGTLILSYNTILFLPDAFSAHSINGANTGVVSEVLNMTLTATTAGFSFDSLTLRETGDYVVDGGGSSVFAYGEMRVRTQSALLNEFHDSFSFSDFGDQGAGFHDWDETATINSSDGWMGTDGAIDSSILLTLQNNLTAITNGPGDEAFIVKKSAGVSITVGPVPVPAAVWLLGSAIVALFGYRKSVI